MDNKFKYKIISALRKLTFQWTPRNEVKNRCKIAPNLFQCESCSVYIYEGTSQRNYQTFLDTYGSVLRSKIHIDHIIPVVDPRKGFTDWNDFINSLFCTSANLQALCEKCHKIKTEKEKEPKGKRGTRAKIKRTK